MKRKIPLDIEFLLESLTNTPMSNAEAKEKLNEDPDAVYLPDDNRFGWSSGDNVAFICTKNYSLAREDSTHWQILEGVIQDYKNGDGDLGATVGDNGTMIGNEPAFMTVMFGGGDDKLKDVVEDFVKLDPEELPDYNFRSDIDGVLTGRLWRDRKIISFWNDQDQVLKHWDNVVNMFDDLHSELGSLRAYSVDWVERQEADDPMTPASDIETSRERETFDKEVGNTPEEDKNGQLNFMAKLFKNPVAILDKLSPEQLEQIRNKIHVLDPELKAQVMKQVGGNLVNKAATIADKLGMSVAEFNSIWNLDETKLNEDPDGVRILPTQSDILNSKGVKVTSKAKVWYDSEDGVCFFIDLVYGITAYNVPDFGGESVRLTHPDLGAEIMFYGAYPDKFEPFKPGMGLGGYGIRPSDSSWEEDAPGNDIGPVAIVQATNEKQMKHYMSQLRSSLPLDGDIPRTSKKFIQGRIWLKENVISFWSTKKHVMDNFSFIEQFLGAMKKTKENVAYEFIDHKHYYTYDELGDNAILTRSREEILDLMKKQHLDPEAKKKLAAMAGEKYQKRDKGFDFQAQRDAAMPALQEIVKRL